MGDRPGHEGHVEVTEMAGPAWTDDAEAERARFERLVGDLHGPLLRYLLRRTDRDTAADVLGDTLLVLWRRRADVPVGAELPWAYGIARGCLANARRGERRRDALAARLVVVDPPGVVTGADAALGGDDPDLTAALARLTPTEVEVLTLWAWEGLSPSEIAAVLGVTANAVSIRLHRAKGRLRTSLEAERAKDPDPRRTGTGRGKEER